jgi:allantoinase
MSAYDLILRGGILVGVEGTHEADLGVESGRIAAIGPDLEGTGKEEVDARGLHVLPGVVDGHVHFNDPGRSHWEGWQTGTAALAAGGATCCVDMPLNAHPPTIDGPSFDLKRQSAEGTALVDFALWGGLVPGRLERLDELAERGVVGFKAFMANSGINDFRSVDDLVLWEGMKRAAELGLMVGVHAESDAITRALGARALDAGRSGVRDYVESRPAVAELQAIARAIVLAEETGCALHVVHVSTGRGVAQVAAARLRGVDVTCETCPHYLVLTEDDMEELGAVAKCAPPLRPAAEVEALWSALEDGTLPMVASDHSPSPAELKIGGDFFGAWGGISGCQSMLALMLSEGHHARGLALERLPELLAGFVARRFRLPGKGRLEVGADADLALVDLGREWTLEAEHLLYRHAHSPFVGRRLRGAATRTLLRGATVWSEAGGIASPPRGRLVTPHP